MAVVFNEVIIPPMLSQRRDGIPVLMRLFFQRFALRPCHSALEFQRCLRKYLEDAEYCQVDTSAVAFHDIKSLRETLRYHLENEGVDFWPNTVVRDLKLLTENSWASISMIEATRNGKSVQIAISMEDIVLVALGSASSGSLTGSNGSPPPPIPVKADRIMNASWSLWFRLLQYSPEFGNPTAFCTHLSESKVEAFTITLQDGGQNLYRYLTEQIGETSSLAIPDSNWSLCISPCQRLTGSEEWTKAYTIWGYGITPERYGNFIEKPMCCCAGQEILSELISHLGPGFDGALSMSITIPRLIPLASASLMRRNRADRPQTIPKNTRNIGIIGIFSEVADDTVCGFEYGIRDAQIAVYGLMGLHQSLPKVGINAVANQYGNRA